MSNFYNQASWVLVPSGIEEDIVFAQKPISGLGDLSFSRASDATYTDASGVVRRSPYNLFQQSEAFDNAAWAKIGSPTVVANAAIAPNGTLTADSVTGAGLIILYQGAFRAQTYTQSCYAKAGTGNVFGMYFGALHAAQFNLTTGTVTSQTGATASIQPVGSGWYRCVLTATTTADQFVGLNFTPNGTVFIWGAQLVEGTSALDYFPTTNRQDVPRIDFRNADGTLSSCGRLLLEPQRTNSIRNSSMVGAVAGTPGTLPTNWLTSNLSGLTQTIVGTGTENGLPYIDIRYNGTGNGSTARILFEGASQIVAANGETWTYSIYFKNVSGTLPTVTRQYILENTSGGSPIVEGFTGVTITSDLKRFNFTRTLSGGASVARVQPYFQFLAVNGQSYDFTIRIAAPQMELGGYATTWVPTTTAAVTRLADLASKTGVSSLIGQTEGTLFLEVNFSNDESGLRFFSINDGTSSNRMTLNKTTNRVVQFVTVVNGSSLTTLNTTTLPLGVNKIAFAYANNDYSFYVNGVLVGTRLSGGVPACNRIDLGNELSSFIFNDRISQSALFTTRLTNAQLAQLTTL